MEHNFADEIYSECLKLSEMKLRLSSTAICEQSGPSGDGDELKYDESSWDDLGDDLDKGSDLDREWQRRRDQFHTIGYRDGLIAGKEASAQEGFNLGFKDSVHVGYKWGLVRGVTSALACLPDDLKAKLIDTQEKRSKFSCLGESVCAISTTDALKLFHDSVTKDKSADNCAKTKPPTHAAGTLNQSRNRDSLEKYFGELQSVLLECPAIEAHSTRDQ